MRIVIICLASFLATQIILVEGDDQNIKNLLETFRLEMKSEIDERITSLENTLLLDTNLAYGKRCGSSSKYANIPPNYAVDGKLTTYQHTDAEEFPYWWVDLGRSFHIERIEIYNAAQQSGDFGYRLHDLDVTVGPDLDHMTLCSTFKGPGTHGQHIVLKCPWNASGKYVMLKITRGKANYLHVAEVQVFGHL